MAEAPPDESNEEIPLLIDHLLSGLLLKDKDVSAGARLAKRYGCATICVSPYAVTLARHELRDSDVRVSTLVGYPCGGNTTQVKVAEAERAIREGARELEVVVNIAKVLSEDWRYVEKDIAAVVRLGHQHRVLVKAVFEIDYLKPGEKRKLCELCSKVRADFVKTSTGYTGMRAEDRDVKLMRKYCSAEVEVEAAGGVQTLSRLLHLKRLGATRVATAETGAILDSLKKSAQGKRRR